MEQDSKNLQNEFFNRLRKDRQIIHLYLTNGKKLTGRVRSFDKFTLMLDGPSGEQMVFKHAIATIGPDRAGVTADGGEAET